MAEDPEQHGDIFQWDEKSTYVQEPPFFVDMPVTPSDQFD
jgi:aconitase A